MMPASKTQLVAILRTNAAFVRDTVIPTSSPSGSDPAMEAVARSLEEAANALDPLPLDALKEALARLDCRDNSCAFAVVLGGMRTNGGCRCLDGWTRPGEQAVVRQLRLLVQRARQAQEG